MSPRTETKKLIIHCSDTTSGTAAAIRRFHMAKPPLGRGWEDIGYHFLIDLDGIIEVGRREDLIGSHCEGQNHDSIGICLIGKDTFQLVQLESLKQIIDSLLNKYGLVAEDVSGHYCWPTAIAQGKNCPNLTNDFLRNLITGETK